MRTEAQIQRRALQVLERAGIQSAPVDPFVVAESLGADVQPEFAEPEISGALYRDADRPVIGVNAKHHPNRQHFTIAHECGHLVLHDQPVYVDRAYTSDRSDRSTPAFLRNAVSSEAIDPVEIEANRFAACLLMPKSFLLQDLRKMRLPLAADAVDSLARSYEVSTQAMTYRLTNLGVPLDIA